MILNNSVNEHVQWGHDSGEASIRDSVSCSIGQKAEKVEHILHWISDDFIVHRIMEHGIEDRYFIDWVREQEESVRRSQDPLRAQVDFEIRLAGLYASANHIDEALRILDGALGLAEHYNLESLFNIIRTKQACLEKFYLSIR